MGDAQMAQNLSDGDVGAPQRGQIIATLSGRLFQRRPRRRGREHSAGGRPEIKKKCLGFLDRVRRRLGLARSEGAREPSG